MYSRTSLFLSRLKRKIKKIGIKWRRKEYEKVHSACRKKGGQENRGSRKQENQETNKKIDTKEKKKNTCSKFEMLSSWVCSMKENTMTIDNIKRKSRNCKEGENKLDECYGSTLESRVKSGQDWYKQWHIFFLFVLRNTRTTLKDIQQIGMLAIISIHSHNF